MICAHALHRVFNAGAVALRKVNRSRRFDRIKAARALDRRVREYWLGGLDALFDFLTETDGWEKIQAHCQSIVKTLSDTDRKFLADLLANYGYFADVDARAAAIVEATAPDTFEKAAAFALRQIGITADFELRNEHIRDLLMDRQGAAIFATRNYTEQVFSTITTNFYELGRNPFNSEFIAQLRQDLGGKTTWEAKRFALTETGIAAEMAQHETYKRNGVTRKQWNILGRNTRPTHQDLSGVQVNIDEQFSVGGYPAAHPLDPTLPPEELVNCHCWLTPVVDDDFQIDPTRIWEGQ